VALDDTEAKGDGGVRLMRKTPEITRLIHDNLWVVISFAFGQPAIAKFAVEPRFKGEWKYLNKTISMSAPKYGLTVLC